MSILELKNISKEYVYDDSTNFALRDVNFKANSGEMIAIMGPSGSGKTTLLNILGCLDCQSSGEYYIDNIDVKNLSKENLAEIRNSKVGFVFQQFALIPEYTMVENVELPMIYGNYFTNSKNKISRKERRETAIEILSNLGLEKHLNKKPCELSGGQQQRVAIARALVKNPNIILADEPTGALDQKTGVEIMSLLNKINSKGKTVIIVTHDMKVASYCSRIVNVVDGIVT